MLLNRPGCQPFAKTELEPGPESYVEAMQEAYHVLQKPSFSYMTQPGRTSDESSSRHH